MVIEKYGVAFDCHSQIFVTFIFFWKWLSDVKANVSSTYVSPIISQKRDTLRDYKPNP